MAIPIYKRESGPLVRVAVIAPILLKAKVYVAGRSESKAEAAINKLKADTGNKNVLLLNLDLADIPSAVVAARELVTKESRLHLFFNKG